MLAKYDGNVELALPGFKEQVQQVQAEKKAPEPSPSWTPSPSSDFSPKTYGDTLNPQSPPTYNLPSVASLATKSDSSTASEVSYNYEPYEQQDDQFCQTYAQMPQNFKAEPFYEEAPYY